MFNRSCVQVVDFTELFGSESMSQVVFALFKLLHDCPGLLDQLTCLAYDDACHLLKFLRLRRDISQYDAVVRRYARLSLARPCPFQVGKADHGRSHMTSDMMSVCTILSVFRQEEGTLHVFVDVAHFDVAHQESDTFCREFTNPHLPEVAKARRNQNSEAAEQSNAWLSRCKLIVRQMSPSRFRGFLLILFWRRNERVIIDFALMAPAKAVREQCVAHRVLLRASLAEDADIDSLRTQLVSRLLPRKRHVLPAAHARAVAGPGFFAATR